MAKITLPPGFWPAENRDLRLMLIPHMEQMYISGMREAARKAGIFHVPNLANERAASWAAEHTDDLLAQLGTTNEKVVGNAISEWIGTEGATIGDLDKALAPFFGASRADLIAVTETTRAFASGEKTAYTVEGIEKWGWNTSKDNLVCPICKGLKGQQVKIGEAFEDVSGEAQDPIYQPPDPHPGCRCWVSPVGEIQKILDMVLGKLAASPIIQPPVNRDYYLRLYKVRPDPMRPGFLQFAYFVNGDMLRDPHHNPHYVDFTEGGNDQVYGGAIPEKPKLCELGEIILEIKLTDEADYILVHETVERDEMWLSGEKPSVELYDRIHATKANPAEAACRGDPGILAETLFELGWTSLSPLQSIAVALNMQKDYSSVSRVPAGNPGGGQWTGSGSLANRLKTALETNDKAHQGAMVKVAGQNIGHEPTDGFSVAEDPNLSDQVPNAADMSREELKGKILEYVDKNRTKLEEDNKYLGLWVDKSTGTLWEDVSTHFPEDQKEEAMAAGRAGNQKSIWSFSIHDEISTGGTGEAAP